MRKIVQIACDAINGDILVLCNDCTLWTTADGDTWVQLSPVPQPETKQLSFIETVEHHAITSNADCWAT